jgi:hypothetical protein
MTEPPVLNRQRCLVGTVIEIAENNSFTASPCSV